MKTQEQGKSWKFRIGVFLFVISNIAFGLLLLVPTLEATIGLKTKLAFALAVVGEVLFWASAYLLGKEILNKYKSRLNPVNWFKREKATPQDKS